MIKKYTIFGERCSGTNYLENLMNINFDVQVTWEYGWKHFFGYSKFSNCDDTLFIGIVRNPLDWLNSFYKEKHHLPRNLHKKENFLKNEFYSIANGNEIMEDRSMYTKERYKNIFDLRNTKLKYLIDDLPFKVNNYILIRYEDLIDDFDNTMNKIKEKGLSVKKDITFPLNTMNYKNNINRTYVKNTYEFIKKEDIDKDINMFYERKMDYKI